MKIYVGQDEWWPVWEIYSKDFGCESEINVPDEKVEWMKKVFKEFQEVQDYISEKWEEQHDKHL